MDAMLKGVKRHAQENYEKGGWDYIVEGCYEDSELITLIGKARTITGAIRKVAVDVNTLADVRSDIQGA
tara:strand:- start:650 stop:856 length:207 start_codon:yes stop_codon:yes gene_type:complete